MRLLHGASKYLVGSSNRRIRGFRASTCEIAINCFCPSDKSLGILCQCGLVLFGPKFQLLSAQSLEESIPMVSV
jgi:hypothetical protein